MKRLSSEEVAYWKSTFQKALEEGKKFPEIAEELRGQGQDIKPSLLVTKMRTLVNRGEFTEEDQEKLYARNAKWRRNISQSRNSKEEGAGPGPAAQLAVGVLLTRIRNLESEVDYIKENMVTKKQFDEVFQNILTN